MQALADDLNKRFPEDTVIQFIELPNIRARLAINKGNFSEAIESLKPGRPYELREGRRDACRLRAGYSLSGHASGPRRKQLNFIKF